MKDSGSVILPISIKMFKLPNKIDYLYNEPLDLTGAQLEITYTDNSTQIIPVTNEMVTGYNPQFSYYGKNELTVLYQKFWTTFDIYQNRFKDVKHNYWAAEPIHMIADMGVITGYPDGTFKPGANVTRAEAIVMIIRFLDSVGGFELDPTIDSTFSDLPNTNWAKTHIMSAVNLGIISGYKDGTFKPNNPITRAELSKMIFNAFDMSVIGEYSNAHPDISTTHWAYDIIMSLSEFNILKGFNDGYFYPNKTTTRAELSAILSRIWF